MRGQVVLSGLVPEELWHLKLSARHGPALTPVVMVFEFADVTDLDGRMEWDVALTWDARTKLRIAATNHDSSTSCVLTLKGRPG